MYAVPLSMVCDRVALSFPSVAYYARDPIETPLSYGRLSDNPVVTT